MYYILYLLKKPVGAGRRFSILCYTLHNDPQIVKTDIFYYYAGFHRGCRQNRS